MKFTWIAGFIVSTISITPAFADQVHLLNGDRISGTIVEQTGKSVQIEAQGIGLISIDKHVIEKALTSSEIQALEAQAMKAKQLKEKPWKIEVGAGFNRKRGNTKSTELYTDGKFTFKTVKNELLLKGRLYYSAEDRKMNAQKYTGTIRFDRRLGQRNQWFAFGSTQGERDRFANIDARLTPHAGLGYWFVERDSFKVKAELGAGFEHTKFRDDTTDNTSEMVVVPKLYAEKRLIGEMKVSEEFTIYPNMTNTGEYRWISETILDNPINDFLSLQFMYLYEFNSSPGVDTKEADSRIQSSVVYKF